MSHTALEELEKRNKSLEDEIQTLRDLFQNLNNERDMENPDQRRSFMLKAQIYQLERQCMLLSQAQSNRAAVLAETENQLLRIISSFQSLVAEKSSGPDVIIKRAHATSYLGNFQKLKNSLYKQSRLESSDSLHIPSLMSGSNCLKSSAPINCLDVFKPMPENLNLNYIADLEQELSSLRKQLYSLNQLLQSHHFIVDVEGIDISKHLFSPWIKQVDMASTKCASALEHCSDQLLALSLLRPSAPWNKCKVAEDFGTLKLDKIMKSLPASIQKNVAVRRVVNDVCQAHNHVTQCQEERIDLLKKQLKYHRAVQNVQSQYLLRFSSDIWKDFLKWKNTVVDGICQPVTGVLQSWQRLKREQCDIHLKQFLSDFKTYESELEKLSTMAESCDSDGEFLKSLNDELSQSLKYVSAKYEAEISKIQIHPSDYTLSS